MPVYFLQTCSPAAEVCSCMPHLSSLLTLSRVQTTSRSQLFYAASSVSPSSVEAAVDGGVLVSPALAPPLLEILFCLHWGGVGLRPVCCSHVGSFLLSKKVIL